jgi:endonuclease YncB( thermonuclease family)
VTDWLWPNSVITRVIDGDTVDVSVTRDIGFEGVVTFPIRLRLNRIDTGPAKTVQGMRAKVRVLTLTAGALVHITTGKGYKYGAPQGRTGEWMAEVLLPDGRNLSDLLVAESLAAYWEGQGPRPGGPITPAPAPTLAA